jgi:hypothetical protein
MTSEAIEESGENVFMLATGLGSGTARRLESESADANEPSGIGWLKPGRRTAIVRFQNGLSLFLHESRPRNPITARRCAFWPSVCGTHHLMSGACG